MSRNVTEYLECIKAEKSLIVLEECIHSLNISIKLSQACDDEKENILSILDLMLSHQNKIVTCLECRSDNNKS